MKNYLLAIGLELTFSENLNELTSLVTAQSVPAFTALDVTNLYHYAVPEVTTEGCGLKAKEPYRLEQTLQLREVDLTAHPNTTRLYHLKQIVDQLQILTGVDWLGIYRNTENLKGQKVLLKEAYYGRFSRAEFPLTPEFAKNSNNSTVGLSKKAIVVQNVEAYDGPYYTCDKTVQSECCLPIVNEAGDLLGIIDAEAFHPDFFTDERLLEISKVAFDLGKSKLLDLAVDEKT